MSVTGLCWDGEPRSSDDQHVVPLEGECGVSAAFSGTFSSLQC